METEAAEKFDRELFLDFHLKINTPFKGLSKQYIIEAIFNEQIQKKWKPQVGDIIVGCTGNIFVIGGKHELVERLGGTLFLFGGNLCSRDGGSFLNETDCGTMNKDGKFYELIQDDKIKDSIYHSSFSDFRFVPYPHEKERM